MSTKIIVLKSSDGHTFRIEEATARQCQTIASNNEIPLPNVTSKILAMVMEHCKKHHVDDAKPSSDEDLKKWDEQFMQTDQSTIFDLILAANYLNIKSLLGLTFQTVADMIKDETPNQMPSKLQH